MVMPSSMSVAAHARCLNHLSHVRGLIQDGVAERLHMAMKNYQRIEYGQNVTLKMLARVANALGVSPADILDEPRPK
ncbi:MAG: helix-turn-helix transcriptional regulator [Polyangia bacterium]|jgi:transcriptional regulator with XRE-family HTH domain